ncbi:MAG: hypothetical protein IKO01_01260 [Kiritimatiellae bacterium]|nr:hypothetical protein [Kiritimatiellia bacterium]MBR4253220.1 hypothetical protein [Kiritimatiellia bacterium]
MKKTVEHALREAAGIAGDTARFYVGALALPVVVPVAVAGVAALSAAALGSWIAGATGRAILSELRRRARLRAPRAPSPSLRGTPAPEEFAADAAVRPRTLAVRLRIGSRLADLAPTLDRGNRYDVSPTGAKRIRGRGRGVRGWLEDNRVGMNYSTLMRYMRLAVRLRALLELDARLPLEWLLPGAAASAEVPAALQGQYATAKRKLAHLMRAHWNFSRLQAHVDGALGLRRLPRPGRAKGQPLDGFLADNVRHELADFLQAGDLPPKLEALRRDALHSFMPGPDRPSSPLPSASPCV